MYNSFLRSMAESQANVTKLKGFCHDRYLYGASCAVRASPPAASISRSSSVPISAGWLVAGLVAMINSPPVTRIDQQPPSKNPNQISPLFTVQCKQPVEDARKH